MNRFDEHAHNDEKAGDPAMNSVQPNKPLLTAIITLIILGCFTLIDTSSSGFLEHFWNFNYATATAFKWAAIIIAGLIWLFIQVFMEAPSESSRLSLAISGSMLWLGLILFYHFADPAYGGTVAFFALVGGLIVVITWTHYLADEF